MVPAVTNKDFKAVSVAVEKSSHTLVQVILTMSNGMRNKIDITNYNANHKFSDAEFKFDKSVHPELEIVDLR